MKRRILYLALVLVIAAAGLVYTNFGGYYDLLEHFKKMRHGVEKGVFLEDIPMQGKLKEEVLEELKDMEGNFFRAPA